MSRIVIAGCGDVGTALGLELCAAGHEVWGLRRSPDKLPAPIRPLAADLSRPDTLRALPTDIDALYYAASAGGFDDARYQAAYVDGVQHVLDALDAGAGGARTRLFFVSSTSVYAQNDGGWVDENTPANADGFSGRALRAGEQLCHDSRYPAAVIRFGGIYGPGRTRLIDQLRAGQARCVPGVYSNRIHRDDCGGFLAHLLTLERPQSLYLGVDNAPVPLCEVLDWLAGQLGVAGPNPSASDGGTRRGGGNKRCDNGRLRASGYRLRYPSYQDGYAAMLAAPTAPRS